jgi:polyhydroxyalkanoate synthesis repressor PhaR
MATEKQPIVIKKYANRRLYHTGTSSYVTLEDLAGLVRGGDDFVVYDAKSGDEITRSVLAQIIFEEENKEGQNLLPITVLRQLIRYYGDSMQAVVPRYLEFSMDNLLKDQSQFREQMAKNLGMKAMEAMEKHTQANMKIFTDAFRLFTPFIPVVPVDDAGGQPASDAPAKPGKGDEIEGLREELSAMRERLDKLSRKV